MDGLCIALRLRARRAASLLLARARLLDRVRMCSASHTISCLHSGERRRGRRRYQFDRRMAPLKFGEPWRTLRDEITNAYAAATGQRVANFQTSELGHSAIHDGVLERESSGRSKPRDARRSRVCCGRECRRRVRSARRRTASAVQRAKVWRGSGSRAHEQRQRRATSAAQTREQSAQQADGAHRGARSRGRRRASAQSRAGGEQQPTRAQTKHG